MAIAPSGTLVELQPNFVTVGLNAEWQGFPLTALALSSSGHDWIEIRET